MSTQATDTRATTGTTTRTTGRPPRLRLRHRVARRGGQRYLRDAGAEVSPGGRKRARPVDRSWGDRGRVDPGRGGEAVSQRTTNLVALAGAIGLAVALGLVFRSAHHLTQMPKAAQGGGVVASPSPAGLERPPTVASPPPVVPSAAPVHWKCAIPTPVPGRQEPPMFYGFVAGLEDEALKKVLAAANGGWDPLFGHAVATLEAAECAALRWRLEGR